MHGNAVDLTGRVFGRLTAIKRSETNPTTKDGHCIWDCVCSCSNKHISVSSHALLNGDTKSCGCLKRDSAKSRFTRWTTPEDKEIAKRFKPIMGRCYNPNNPKYPRWGGRGITICDEWLHDKSKFVEWAKTHGYASDKSINRLDNNGPYAPWNCEWTDNKTQSNNRSSNIRFEIDGESHTVMEWAEIAGLDYEKLRRTYHRDVQTFMNRVVNSQGFEEHCDAQEVAAVLKEQEKRQE